MQAGRLIAAGCLSLLLAGTGCGKQDVTADSRPRVEEPAKAASVDSPPKGLHWQDMALADVQLWYRGHNDNAIWFEAPANETMAALEVRFGRILEKNGWQRGEREQGLTKEDLLVLAEMGDTPENRATFESEKVNTLFRRDKDELHLLVERDGVPWKVTYWLHSAAVQERFDEALAPLRAANSEP